MNALSSLPEWLLFVIIVGIPICLSCLATFLTFLWMKRRAMGAPGDPQKTAASSVAMILNFLLGFLVVTVWGNFRAADQAVAQEAASMVVIAHIAHSLPQPVRSQVFIHLQRYTDLVIEEEWPLMAEGKSEGGPRTLAEFGRLWAVCQDALAKVPLCGDVLKILGQLTGQRVLRLLSSRSYLPDVFWFVLILGSLLVITLNLLLHDPLSGFGAQLLIKAIQTGAIFLLLWLIIVINNPYAGDVSVTPNAFQNALLVIKSLAR